MIREYVDIAHCMLLKGSLIHQMDTDWGENIYIFGKNAEYMFRLYCEDDDINTIGLTSLSVLEGFRKQGYGNSILVFCKTVLNLSDKKRLMLSVLKDTWVEKWYMRNGFTLIKNCADNKYDYLIYMKK